MDTRTVLWNRIADDSKEFGCHERLTPHIYALYKATNKYLSNLKTGTVLDVGAGDKRYRDYINCRKYVSFDISGKVDVRGDATSLPFKNNSFDMIICTQVLEHIKNPFLAAEEFSRILKEKGTLFITVPTVMYLHETPNDYFRYTKYGIEYLLNENSISIMNSITICSGFLVGLELFFIGIYSVVYKIIKSNFARRIFIGTISGLSFIAYRFDMPFFRTIFPGNIMILASKLGKEDRKEDSI